MSDQVTSGRDRDQDAPSAERFATVFFEHDGHLSDKWEQYLPIYEFELRRFAQAGRPVRLLEIGVQNGGSLQIWAKYLPEGSTIIGMDIDEKCAAIPFEGNIKVLIGDASDAAMLDRLIGDQRFDIIIDDGSHRSDDIIATFRTCFPRLEAGGLYLAEDLHCSYFPTHAGGFRRRGSSIEWFKSLIDGLNADYFEDDRGVSAEERAELKAYNHDIARIAFYDSVAVVEKLSEPKTAPYRRVMSGRSTPVVNFPTILDHLTTGGLKELVLAPDMTTPFGPAMLRAISEAREEVGAAREKYEAFQRELSAARSDIEKYARELVAIRKDQDGLRTRADAFKERAENAEAEIRFQQGVMSRERSVAQQRISELTQFYYAAAGAAEVADRAAKAQADSLTTEVQKLAAESQRLTDEIRAMKGSTLWRLTSPVRAMAGFLPAGARGALRRVLGRPAAGN